MHNPKKTKVQYFFSVCVILQYKYDTNMSVYGLYINKAGCSSPANLLGQGQHLAKIVLFELHKFDFGTDISMMMR